MCTWLSRWIYNICIYNRKWYKSSAVPTSPSPEHCNPFKGRLHRPNFFPHIATPTAGRTIRYNYLSLFCFWYSANCTCLSAMCDARARMLYTWYLMRYFAGTWDLTKDLRFGQGIRDGVSVRVQYPKVFRNGSSGSEVIILNKYSTCMEEPRPSSNLGQDGRFSTVAHSTGKDVYITMTVGCLVTCTLALYYSLLQV